MYKLPVMYIEYSGTYGNKDYVKAAADMLTETQLFYGGGIDSLEAARALLPYVPLYSMYMTGNLYILLII